MKIAFLFTVTYIVQKEGTENVENHKPGDDAVSINSPNS